MSRLFCTRLNLMVLVLVAEGLTLVNEAPRTHGQEVSGEANISPEPSPEVKRIAFEMRRHVAAIKSIHFSFRQAGRSPARGQGPWPIDKRPLVEIVRTGEFAYDTGKFLSLYEVVNDGKRSTWVKAAFDGNLYQRFDPVRKQLGITTTFSKSEGGQHPLWIPFYFVKRETDRTDLETLGSEDLWLDFSRKATLLAPRRVGERDCEVLQYIRPSPSGREEQTWEICAAKDLGYFPIQQAIRRTGFNSVREFMAFEEFDTPEGTLVIPTRSIAKAWANGEKLVQEEDVELTLLSVNQALDAATFTLATDQAQVVTLSDVPPEARMRYEPHELQVSGSAGAIVWAVGLVVLSALFAVAWRKSRKSSAIARREGVGEPPETNKPSRRWPQFSLRGLMAIVVLAATFAGLVRSLRTQIAFGGLPASAQTPIAYTAIRYEWDEQGRPYPRVVRRYRPVALPYSETWFTSGQDGKPNVEKRVLYYSNRQKAIEELPFHKYQCWLPNGKAASWKEANAMLHRDNGDGTFAVSKPESKSVSE